MLQHKKADYAIKTIFSGDNGEGVFLLQQISHQSKHAAEIL